GNTVARCATQGLPRKNKVRIAGLNESLHIDAIVNRRTRALFPTVHRYKWNVMARTQSLPSGGRNRRLRNVFGAVHATCSGEREDRSKNWEETRTYHLTKIIRNSSAQLHYRSKSKLRAAADGLV